jgi:hypothetical protein
MNRSYLIQLQIKIKKHKIANLQRELAIAKNKVFFTFLNLFDCYLY